MQCCFMTFHHEFTLIQQYSGIRQLLRHKDSNKINANLPRFWYGSQAKVDKSFALTGAHYFTFNKTIYRAFGIIIVCLFFEKERSVLI